MSTQIDVKKRYENLSLAYSKLKQIPVDELHSIDRLRSYRPPYEQQDLIAESILFHAYRTYEEFIESVFLDYCLGAQTNNNQAVKSFLRPKNQDHARELIRALEKFIEWDADRTIQRAELFLEDGFPIKNAIVLHKSVLVDIRKIRNYIAHSSKEAENKYNQVIKNAFGTAPLEMPFCGQFLRLYNNKTKDLYLTYYTEVLENIAREIVGL